MMTQKLALIIGNSEYDDTSLARLVTPGADVDALAGMLQSPDIGGFDEVVELVNQPATAVRRAIARFFAAKQRDDLLLLYFSGHGVLDDRGHLYLAVKDTERGIPKGTAIEASFITDVMDSSNSRRQVLILDCCHSGAFARGTKGAPGASVHTATAFEGIGSGRVVLTATDSTQYAWEGDRVIGEAENSVFTHYLIEGLKTGEADADGDGQITLDELYDYVYEQVVHQTPKQTPGKWSYRQQGEIVIAKNPRPVVKPVGLPSELQQTIEDSRSWVREGAVRELDRLLQGSHPGLAQAARESLARLADDDSRRVSTAAAASLAAYADAQRAKEQEREEQVRRARETARVEAERLAAQKAEAERIAREKAEQERLAQEKANAERLAAQKAEAERLAREQAEQERIAREKAETDQATAPAKAIWLPVLLTAIGWGLGFVIGAAITREIIGTDGWALAGAIGGLTTGMALRRTESSMQQMERVLMVAGAWVIAGAIGWGIAGTIGETVNAATDYAPFGAGDWTVGKVIGWFIGWAMFGAFAGFAVWRVKSSIPHKQALTIAGGWFIAGAIGWIIPQLIADTITAIGRLVSEAETYLVAATINRILAWVSAGAIGSGVMYWMFNQARRKT